LGQDDRYAPSFREARHHASLRNSSAEDILRFKPDLVLATSYSPPESVALLRRAGVKVLIIERFETLEDVYGSLRTLGRALGRSAQAEALIRTCQQRVEALAQRLRGAKPVRVMAAGVYPYAAGADTSFQDICDHAAALNVAAEAGLKGHVPMPGEKALAWNPDVLIAPQEGHEDVMAQLKGLAPYKFMKALRQGRVVTLPASLMASTSHRRIEAYEWVARALHPERFP
ncbi:MAG: ABC transporter substrate-binding protein, partial [Firmicutes bacterium]|nr:ABC transporter substrate-binding protein [Bacillota bacterium]